MNELDRIVSDRKAREAEAARNVVDVSQALDVLNLAIKNKVIKAEVDVSGPEGGGWVLPFGGALILIHCGAERPPLLCVHARAPVNVLPPQEAPNES